MVIFTALNGKYIGFSAELFLIISCKAARAGVAFYTPVHILKLVMAFPPVGPDMKRKDKPIQQDIFETV